MRLTYIPVKASEEDPLLNRRVGKIKVSTDLVIHNPTSVMRAFADCLVVRCSMEYATMTFDYLLISKHFDVIEEYTEPPEYEVIVTADNTGSVDEPVYTYTYEFKRVTP